MLKHILLTFLIFIIPPVGFTVGNDNLVVKGMYELTLNETLFFTVLSIVSFFIALITVSLYRKVFRPEPKINRPYIGGPGPDFL